MTVFAPSSAPEVEAMLATALTLDGPSVIRFPKTPAPPVAPGHRGLGPGRPAWSAAATARCASWPWARWSAAAEEAADRLGAEGIDVTVWDPRVVSHPDPAMLADAGRHALVVTVEDGIRQGGAGHVPGRRPPGARCRSAPAPPVVHLGVPRATWPRASPTGSWPGSASTTGRPSPCSSRCEPMSRLRARPSCRQPRRRSGRHRRSERTRDGEPARRRTGPGAPSGLVAARNRNLFY